MLKKPSIYFTTVSGSVSRILDREFESFETFSRFAQVLGENQPFQMISEKKIVEWQKSRHERCDFTKKNIFFPKVSNGPKNERKICKLTMSNIFM